MLNFRGVVTYNLSATRTVNLDFQVGVPEWWIVYIVQRTLYLAKWNHISPTWNSRGFPETKQLPFRVNKNAWGRCNLTRLYYQPKQRTIKGLKGKVLQHYHTFVVFHSPQMGNLMIPVVLFLCPKKSDVHYADSRRTMLTVLLCSWHIMHYSMHRNSIIRLLENCRASNICNVYIYINK